MVSLDELLSYDRILKAMHVACKIDVFLKQETCIQYFVNWYVKVRMIYSILELDALCHFNCLLMANFMSAVS